MSVEVIIPYAGEDPDRELALTWVAERCEHRHTVAKIDLPFNKARAFMPAVEASEADIIVMHDADVWTPGLTEAINVVANGDAAWAIPHWNVYRLTKDSTARFMQGQHEGELARPLYVGTAGGGIVVAHRDTILDIPMDPRFTAWGQEDESWAMALWCLKDAPWRGKAPLIHFWHDLEERRSQRMGSQAGWDLRNRYVRVRYDLPGMRDLLAEAKDAFLLPS